MRRKEPTMNRGTLDERLRVFAQQALLGDDGDVIGILYETTDDGLPDGMVRVNGSEAQLLTPEEFRYDYPRGVLIRVRYGDGLPKADEGDT
jgi:hypothetical protein